jgi:hypothetical protein
MKGAPIVIADLTEQSFENIVAPDEARRWPRARKRRR